jgi:hypothetical protein
MQQAGKAMKEIHGGMNLEQVDETMYVIAIVIVLSHDYIEDILFYYEPDPLTRKQGQTPRTTPTQRGDRTGDYQRSAWRTARRGGAGCRVGGTGAGGHGRAYAQYWPYTCRHSAGPVTGRWKYGA